MTEKNAKKKPKSKSGKPSAAAARKAAIKARSGSERRRRGAPAPAASYPIGKERKALKGISIYMHPLAKEVLDKIAEEEGKSVQDLGIEALNLLFLQYGEKPIA